MNKTKKLILTVGLAILLVNVVNHSFVMNSHFQARLQNSFSDMGWHLREIDIEGAWNYTYGSSDITVAVIDSGIDFNHSELQNAAWINEDEIANNSIDDDANGYVDDIHGWDFTSNDSVPGPEEDDPIHWHATFIAGLIAAPLDNIGIAGVAPNVTVMDLRVLKADNYQGTSLAELGDAIRYAVDNGADVINLSLQYYSASDLYKDDILYAIEQNVAVVSITGNTWVSNGGGREIPSYPGTYEEVIAVGATDYYQNKADYSNYGEWTEIVAPVGNEGTGVRSTAPPDQYFHGWGTSFACPQVAAVIGLMKSMNSTISVAKIREILQETAVDLGDEGKDNKFGYGMLNASAALEELYYVSEGIEPPTEKSNSPILYLQIFTIAVIVLFSRKLLKRKNS